MSNNDWRNNVEDGSLYSVYPKDFDDETEYMRILNEEKDMWRIYRFCTVCISSNEKDYHYFTGSADVRVGDYVYVPFGKNNIQVVGEVTSVGECLGLYLPCRLCKMKTIYGKTGFRDERVIN